jgi:hypothetical protein
MIKTRSLSICLLLMFGLSGGTVWGVTLLGGVQHSEYEAPIGRYNQTFGAQLQSFQNLSSPSYDNADATQSFGAAPAQTFQAQSAQRVDWFKVPPWMAGTWTKKGDMTTSVTDLRSGRSSMMQQWTEDELTVTWGHQIDRAGNIWEANVVPSERDAVSDAKPVSFLLVNCHCESTSPQQVITRMHYIVSENQGWGAGAVEPFQQESLNDYTPISAVELQNYSSTRVFSSDGRPLRDGMLLSRFQRVAPFRIINNLDGIDLRASFSYFLRTHNMAELAPDQDSAVNRLPVVPEP